MEGLEDVELLVFDKTAGLQGLRDLRSKLAGRRFDVLLQMQLALRANLLSALISAERRIGYDRARSKEGHSLFINERIPPGGHHVLDVFGSFCEPLGPAPGTGRMEPAGSAGRTRLGRAAAAGRPAHAADIALLQPRAAQLEPRPLRRRRRPCGRERLAHRAVRRSQRAGARAPATPSWRR